MSLSNFLPVNRKLQEHWIFKDSCYLHCWMEMLFNARFSEEPKTDIFKGSVYTINRGEFIFSRSSYAKRLNIKESKIRTFLNLLIEHKMLEKVASLGENKPTIYKICNYEMYNGYSNSCQANTEQTPSEHPVNTEQTPSEHVDIALFDSDVHRANAEQTPSEHPVNTEQTPLKKNVKKDKNVKNENNILTVSVINYLNEKANTNYKPTTDKTIKLINARVREGYNLEDFKTVIDVKSKEWLNTDMRKYLRPETIFGNKFESYLNQKTVESNIVKDTPKEKRLGVPEYDGILGERGEDDWI